MTSSSPDTLLAQNDGITINSDCLINGICGLDTDKVLWVNKSNPEQSPSIFLQDITLAATTFIGTVIVIAFIVSAIMMIMGGMQGNESMASNGKKGMGYTVIGFLLVIFSYSIIKLVQFIAAW